MSVSPAGVLLGGSVLFIVTVASLVLNLSLSLPFISLSHAPVVFEGLLGHHWHCLLSLGDLVSQGYTLLSCSPLTKALVQDRAISCRTNLLIIKNVYWPEIL